MNNRVFFFMAFFFVGVVTLIIVRNDETSEEQRNREMFEAEFSGVLDTLYNDRNNHLEPVLKLKGGREILPVPYRYYFELKKHDSLVKHKGNYQIEVYRNKRLQFTIDLNVPENHYKYDPRYPREVVWK